MGFYRRHVFPWLVELTASGGELAGLRRQLLAEVRGEVLEIGFGTGANLGYYPPAAGPITAVDSNPGMHRLARRRLARSPLAVALETQDAEELRFDAGSFDTVVSTLTLCSIPDVGRALGEVRRVLRPGGRLLFLEHGLAEEPRVQRWQRRLTPIQRLIGDGCRLDRNVAALVEAAGLVPAEVERSRLSGVPKVLGSIYLGSAVRP